MKKALIEFPDDLHRNLKRRALDEDISLKELIVKAVRTYIEEHPPSPPAQQTLPLIQLSENQQGGGHGR
jgi:hypothetical protein